MEVPCPVPLQNAWSPVGYQVVEENVPQARTAGAADEPVPEPCLPSSPVGYRVVETSGAPSAPQPAPRRTRAPINRPARSTMTVPVRKKPPRLLWGAFAAGGAVVLIAMIAIIAVRMSSAMPDPQQADAGPVVLPQVIVAAQPKLQPKAEPPAPVPQPAKPKEAAPPAPNPAPIEPDGPVNLAGIGPAPAELLAPGGACKVGRQTFGTTVAFARNPSEANRQAAEEHKLTFVLHVSGNFEEARFT